MNPGGFSTSDANDSTGIIFVEHGEDHPDDGLDAMGAASRDFVAWILKIRRDDIDQFAASYQKITVAGADAPDA